MSGHAIQPNRGRAFANKVRSAILWRSGSQIAAQLVQWAATFLVIRILEPADYGLFAMTQVVLVLLNLLNGYGLASGLVQREHIESREVRQLFGMLLLLNGGLALAQVALAPLAAAYYRHPEVATLLRVQALLYLFTPFVALGYALLSREMDFRRQASVNIAASIASAATALGGALAGWGVWTLVAAPAVLFGVRAVGMTWAAGSLIRPSFDFRGAGALARYGGLMAASQLFWFCQSQADVLIAGRWLGAHDLGLYTTALFLSQIFVAKFVPPVNEVAFSAYARLQHEAGAVGHAFLRGARIVMALALPFYAGLAVTAAPLVESVLGAKWTGMAPLVPLLALAMPFMTMQVLLTPACDAQGRPDVGVRNGAVGALILAAAFLVGVRFGVIGLGWAWLAAYPLYFAASLRRSLPIIGAAPSALWSAIVPALLAATLMAAAVLGIDAALPPMAAVPRLVLLVTAGGLAYPALLVLFGRDIVTDLIRFVRGDRLQTD